ncbi:MAG: YeeE/YedE family protein [Crocinitomix sp.]|nr:YeeE/YedE family protein [Crocinitomix sp.]
MLDAILQPWPWYVSGPLIALVMLFLLLTGKNFGMSSNLRTMCSIGGAGKAADFFKFDWKSQLWNLMVVVGAVLGGFFASQYMSEDATIDLSENTVVSLEAAGFQNAGDAYLPEEIFGWEAVTSFKGLMILIVGGLLIGFGTRWAGGCTSGHAISGISNLQLPSLIAVIGFFIGGIIMTFFILPYLL